MNYDAATAELLQKGMRVFQGAMLAPTEAEHCERLFELYRPRGTVVDMGCGVGEVCRHFVRLAPELNCIGVTNNSAQAYLAADAPLSVVLADMAATGLEGGCADTVMFNESFGYGRPRALLAEAFRLLKPGGRLCIKDFSVARPDPSIGAAEAAWDYTVHEPEALALYAELAGFKPVRVHRRIPADLSRWLEFMGSYSLADQHRHEPQGANLAAAVYVFEKPDAAPAPRRPTLAEALKGDADAIRFCNTLHRVLHTWDDVVDGDAPAEAAINAAFRAALVDIPLNPFFARHAAVLCPVLAAGITAWTAANELERGPDREAWRKAHMLRVHVGAVFVLCAELVGGYEWGVLMAPYLYDQVQGDALATYMNELEDKHARAHRV